MYLPESSPAKRFRRSKRNSYQHPSQRRGRQKRNTYRKKEPSGEGFKKGLAYGFYLFTAISILAGVSLLLVLGYQYLLTFPNFCIKNDRHIEIEGLGRLTPAQIMETGHLRRGISLISIRPLKVEKDLTQHPWIEKAEITRLWPDRLRIVIQEQYPLAIVHLDSLYYLNPKGELFKALDPGDSRDLPVITGLKAEHFQTPKDRACPLLTRLVNFVELLKETPAPLNVQNIAEIHVKPERGFTIYPISLGIGLDVGFQDYSQKLANFRRIMPVLKKTGKLPEVAKINLNYPRKVLVSFKRPDLASP